MSNVTNLSISRHYCQITYPGGVLSYFWFIFVVFLKSFSLFFRCVKCARLSFNYCGQFSRWVATARPWWSVLFVDCVRSRRKWSSICTVKRGRKWTCWIKFCSFQSRYTYIESIRNFAFVVNYEILLLSLIISFVYVLKVCTNWCCEL